MTGLVELLTRNVEIAGLLLGGGGGAVVCDFDGAGVAVTGGIVGVTDALGVVLAMGLFVPAAWGVLWPLSNRTSNRTTARSRTPPTIPRTSGSRDLGPPSPGPAGAGCASKRCVGVSSLMVSLARLCRDTPNRGRR